MKILKIGAIWCPECLIMRPRWLEIQKELPWLEVDHIEVDEQPELKARFAVDHIPTIIFLDQNNNEIARLKGLIEKEDLLSKIIETKDR